MEHVKYSQAGEEPASLNVSHFNDQTHTLSKNMKEPCIQLQDL